MQFYGMGLHRLMSGAVAAGVGMLLTGCGLGPLAAPNALTADGVSGTVFGGQQPVVGATVQMYAAGTNGYGSAAIPLLNRSVVTQTNGSFSLSGTFTCPSSGTPVYLLVTGGNPGLAPGMNNNALALMALLGPCGNLGPGVFINVNELTTVAGVWTMAPFMLDGSHIGTSATNAQGLVNAFNTAANLVTLLGKSPGTAPAIATIPSAEINTLGDVLAACVNSNGNTATTASCGRLFNAAQPAGGIAPTDTILAALDIARNPAHNAGAIYSSLPANGPYQPTLANAPSDWTIGIKYASAAFKSPTDIAIDSQGNAWVLSVPVVNTPSSNVSILNTTGIVATYAQPGIRYGRLALDPYDDPWLTNGVGSNVVELTSSGTRATLNAFSGGGINGPGALAFDGLGNAWVANNGPTTSKLSANGAPLSPATGYATAGSSGPSALALDPTGNAWVADASGNTIEVLANNGKAVPGSPYTGAGFDGPYAIAIDSTGGAWVANRTGSSLSRISSNGQAITGSPFYGAGLNAPVDMGLDGLGNVWLANSGANSVSEFLSTGRPQSGAGGYGSATLSNPFRMAIDKSGNVWVANLGSTVAGTSFITQIVGAAAPVVTPLSVAVQNNALNQRP